MAPYFKAGWALNLKPELDKGWNKNFAPGLLDFDEFWPDNPAGVPAGIYQAPWEVNTYGTLYNPAQLEKAGLDPKKAPATTAEMLDMPKKLKAANVGPFVIPSTYIPLAHRGARLELADGQQIDDARAGKASYKADAWKKALQYFVDLRDAKVIFNNTLNQTAPDNEKSFFNVQEVAMFWTSVVLDPGPGDDRARLHGLLGVPASRRCRRQRWRPARSAAPARTASSSQGQERRRVAQVHQVADREGAGADLHGDGAARADQPGRARSGQGLAADRRRSPG